MTGLSPNPGAGQAAVARILGPQALMFGPFGLLALDPSLCTPERVEAALQAQLDRVSRHPEGETAAGDEVRLGLHAAAAQLLNPIVRRHLVDKWVGPYQQALAGGEISIVEEAPPPAPTPAATSRSHWKDPNLRRSAARAGAAGIGVETAIERHVERGDGTRAEYRRRHALNPVVVIAGLLAGLMAVFLLALVVLWPRGGGGSGTTGGSGATPAVPVNGGATVSAGSPSASKSGDSAKSAVAGDALPTAEPASDGVTAAPMTVVRERTAFVDPALVVRNLRASSATAKQDAAKGLTEFAAAVRSLEDWWCKFDVGQRRAADDAVVEFVYTASALAGVPGPGEAGSPLGLVAAGAKRLAVAGAGAGVIKSDEVWRASWSAGMLTRLSRERELPLGIGSMVNTVLAESLGAGRPGGEQSFEAGALAALRRLPSFMLRAPIAPASGAASAAVEGPAPAKAGTTAFERYAEAVAAAVGGEADENARERMLADAIESVMVHSREPEEDLSVFEAIHVLATSIKWRQGGPARARLLDWLRDPRVSLSDVRVLTAAVATRSSAEGVDATMVLSIGAGAEDRMRLLGRYAKAWDLAESAARGVVMDEWQIAANSAISTAGTDSEAITDLPSTVTLARLNEAARLIWRGESQTAQTLIHERPTVPGLDTGKDPRDPNTVVFFSPGAATGGWAETYLAAERNIPLRLERIAEIERRTPPINSADAAVLTDAALFGSPLQVRSAAQRAMGIFADDPVLVNAVLEALPGAPKVTSISDAVSRIARTTLPRVTDPNWELVARRALVERLLGLLASGTPDAAVEAAAGMIADSYLRSAGQEPAHGAGAAAEGLIVGADLLWGSLRREAESAPLNIRSPLTLAQIDRRRAGRLRMAAGPVQTFAAHQASVADALAYLVASERPAQTGAVAGILDELAVARRGAGHILQQIRATERAILRLWVVRMGEDDA